MSVNSKMILDTHTHTQKKKKKEKKKTILTDLAQGGTNLLCTPVPVKVTETKVKHYS